MANLEWNKIWKTVLEDKELFPSKKKGTKTLVVSCPTRFSNTGKFTIEITPSFKDEFISLEMLIFNDNLSVQDISTNETKTSDFNALADQLVSWEDKNRLQDRFEINSDNFENDKEATQALVDYINNKATESGRMFDDKLDELNDLIRNNKSESYKLKLESIRKNRKLIFRKVECILRNNFNWKSSKYEEFDDSVASFYDVNDNLVAVVSLVDSELLIDLSKDITSKVSVLQSDEDIEEEIVSDIENAETILDSEELDQMKDTLAKNKEHELIDVDDVLDADVADLDDEESNLESDEDDEYIVSKNKKSLYTDDDPFMQEMFRRVTKLENLYIKKYLNK